jgi:hypothetical protein
MKMELPLAVMPNITRENFDEFVGELMKKLPSKKLPLSFDRNTSLAP